MAGCRLIAKLRPEGVEGRSELAANFGACNQTGIEFTKGKRGEEKASKKETSTALENCSWRQYDITGLRFRNVFRRNFELSET